MMTLINIKTDKITYSEKDKKWGYYGKKSQTMEMDFDALTQFVIDNKRSGIHEALVGEAYKPYADLDWSLLKKDADIIKYSLISEREFNTLNDTVIVDGYCAIRKLFGDDVVVFSASSFALRKISAHYIVNGLYYTNKEHILYMMKKIDMDGLHIDDSVYSTDHLMRVPLCSKPGQDRPLVRIQCRAFGGEKFTYVDDKADFETDLIDGLITYVNVDDEAMPAPEGYLPKVIVQVVREKKDYTVEEQTKNYKHIEKLIDALAQGRASHYKGWTEGIWAIHRVAVENNQLGPFRALVQKFAMKTDRNNYAEADTDNAYMSQQRDDGVGYTRLKEWADFDSPGWDVVKELIVDDVFTFYDKKHEILASNPTKEDIQQYMLGCLRYCNRKGKEEWFQHSSDGWYRVDNKANFPYSTKSSNTKFEKTSFQDILVELKDTLVFQSCMTEGAIFYPYYGANTRPKIINLFRGWPYKETNFVQTPSTMLFINHILLLMGDVPGKYFLDTITRKLRFPREKGKFIIMYGKYGGEGKNLVEDVLTAVFGALHVLSSAGTKSVLGQGEAGFNSLAEFALIVLIQEAKAKGKSIVCKDKFKSWLSEPMQQIRRMHTDPYQAPNYSNAILFTNNADCIEMDSAMARRTMAVEVNDLKADDKEHFDPLWAISKSTEQTQQLFNYLISRDISDFDINVIPQTAFMEKMKEDSFNTAQRYVIQICNDNADVDNGIIDRVKQDFYRDFRTYCNDEGIHTNYIPTLKSFTNELENVGITCKQKHVKGDRFYCYTLNYNIIQTIMRKMQKNKKWELLKPLLEIDV